MNRTSLSHLMTTVAALGFVTVFASIPAAAKNGQHHNGQHHNGQHQTAKHEASDPKTPQGQPEAPKGQVSTFIPLPLDGQVIIPLDGPQVPPTLSPFDGLKDLIDGNLINGQQLKPQL
jgi:hypothetical protein